MGEVTAIAGACAVLPGGELPDATLIIEDDKIQAVGPSSDVTPPERANIIDARGLYLFPGLIDTHVHGCLGDDVMHCGPEGLRRISRAFAKQGTTAWLPSTISARHEDLLRSIEWCVEARTADSAGAEIAGIHVEGPYLNPKRKGAQPEEGIRDPDFDELDELLAASQGLMRIMTLAPELPGGLELIRRLRAAGVTASLGHSDANFEQAEEAIAEGATHATHLFNAMPPIHHRDPGLITACLQNAAVIAEVIPDGVHLHPRIVMLILETKPHDAAVLITDAFSATGLPDGEHTLGPHRVQVRGPRCTLADGTIAGSIISMRQAAANAIEFAHISRHAAATMASMTPARLAGCADRKGSLAAGMDADLALFTSDFACRATWVRGRLVHQEGLASDRGK